MELDPRSLIPFLTVAGLIAYEWRYRAKRDGKTRAALEIALALIVVLIGIYGQRWFGDVALPILVVILSIATTALFWYRFFYQRPRLMHVIQPITTIEAAKQHLEKVYGKPIRYQGVWGPDKQYGLVFFRLQVDVFDLWGLERRQLYKVFANGQITRM